MVFTSSYGAKVFSSVVGSTSMLIFSPMVSETPMRPSSSIVVVTSCRCGTLRIITGLSASRVPARIGNTAFFEPDTLTSPESGIPPLMINLFMHNPWQQGRLF